MLQSDFEEGYDADAFEVVHIDTDGVTATALHNHWDTYDPTFPVLVGCQSLLGDYGDGYIPYNVLIDTEGIVRFTNSGFDETAMQEIIEQYMSVDFPSMAIAQLNLTGDDNGDGRPDGGESVEYELTLRNSPIAVASTGCTVTMVCDDPDITVTNATVHYPAAVPGQTVAGDGVFTFTVAPGIEARWSNFAFNWSATYAGGTQNGQLVHVQRVGRPPLLLVDTDGADDNETFIQTGLVNLGVEADLWPGYTSPLAADEMQRYSQVVWLGGQNTEDITDDEETALRAFVLGGGRLLLSSQYLSDNPARTDFLADIFGVTVTNADAGNIFVVDCVAGDPWWDGTAMVVSGTGGAGNNEEPDVLAVDPAVGTVFGTWRQAPGGPAAMYTNGERKAIFCGFPVEAARVHGSVAGSMNATTLMEHVLAYFGETGVEEPLAPVRDFHLAGASPNPFNPATTVELRMERAGNVELSVYNLAGQQVLALGAGPRAAGTHQVRLDGQGLASGLYMVRLDVDGQPVDAMKVMLVK